MKRKRPFFVDSSLALSFSWGIAYAINRPDREAVLLMAEGLCILCLLILLPLVLKNLKPQKPLAAGVKLPFYLSPLLFSLSHPAFSIAPLTIFFLEPRTSDLLPWLINFIVNLLIFLLTGVLFVQSGTEKPAKWRKALFATLLLAAIYAGLLYGGAQLFES